MSKISTLINRIFLMVLSIIGSGMIANAQQTEADSSFVMNLEECVSYAIKNNKTLQNARLDQQIAQKDVEEIIGRGLPQLDIKSDLIYNFELPVFVLPNPDVEGEFNEITFGLPWQTSAGATLNQLIFDGRYFLGLRAAKVFVDLADKQAQQSLEDLAYNVNRAYYTALISEEQLSLINTNIERVEKLYKETAAMNKEGFVEKIDVDRLEISLNNLKTQQETAKRMTKLSKDLLKFQMGMPVYMDIQLEGLNQSIRPSVPNPIAVSDFNPAQKVEYQMLVTSKELETFNMRQHKVGYIPALYAFGSYTLNRQWDDVNAINYRTGAVGLQLNWSLFDGGQRIKKIQKSRIELRKLDNQIIDFENGSRLEVEEAYSSLTDAYGNWNSQQRNKDLAEKVYNISTIKYREGVGSSLEVNDAETQLKEAESNYLNSIYNYLMARIDLDKALGEYAKYQE